MNDSLSIILPVHNVQATLRAELEHMLEVLPELATPFDILIIDDASTDSTEEIACELAATYAQICCTRHPLTLGEAHCLHTALCRTDGDYMLLRQPRAALRADALPRLWAERDKFLPGACQPAASAPPAAEPSGHIGWLDRLMHWGQALRAVGIEQGTSESGFRLYRREQAAALQLKLRGQKRKYRYKPLASIPEPRPTSQATDANPAVPAPKSAIARPAPIGPISSPAGSFSATRS